MCGLLQGARCLCDPGGRGEKGPLPSLCNRPAVGKLAHTLGP